VESGRRNSNGRRAMKKRKTEPTLGRNEGNFTEW
jgi:hypothetical protein